MRNTTNSRKHNTVYCVERIFFLTFLLASILSACGSSQLNEPTLTPSPSDTPTVVPTFTPSPTQTSILLGNYELLSPEDMRFDLDELFHRIETTHPNPYTKRAKAEVDLERQRIYAELLQPMTVIDYYKKIAPLVNSLGDYHTTILTPNNAVDVSKELLFPFDVQMEGDRAYIISNYSGNANVKLVTELLEVNSLPIAVIYDESKGYFPIGSTLRQREFWFLFGSLREYQVKLLLSGETEPVNLIIPSLTFEELMQHSDASQSGEPVVYATLPGEKIGVLNINSFVGIGPLLKTAFTQIQEDGVQHLIIDTRTNRGGFYDSVESFMDYLTDEPYKLCSQSYQAPFGGYGSGNPRESTCELIQPVDVSQRYRGKLYLLIGPDTFSGAITFATILQDSHLALLIGEETTDSASYCANIIVEGTSLPRTGLKYVLSRTCFIRPSGVVDDRGVIPDFTIKTTVEDQIAGNDPVLTYTLEMIRGGNPP